MHTNHAAVFGHTHLKVKEPENINMCCLCVLFFCCVVVILSAPYYWPLHGTILMSV